MLCGASLPVQLVEVLCVITVELAAEECYSIVVCCEPLISLMKDQVMNQNEASTEML